MDRLPHPGHGRQLGPLPDGVLWHPLFPSSTPMPGEVRLDLGVLDVYPRPDVDATPIAQLYDGAQVTVINEYADWYLIQFGDRWGMWRRNSSR